MTDTATFRKKAEKCREQAAKMVNPIEKQRWMVMSERWLRLAQSPDLQQSVFRPKRRASK
jgi:hypothetical protein